MQVRNSTIRRKRTVLLAAYANMTYKLLWCATFLSLYRTLLKLHNNFFFVYEQVTVIFFNYFLKFPYKQLSAKVQDLITGECETATNAIG